MTAEWIRRRAVLVCCTVALIVGGLSCSSYDIGLPTGDPVDVGLHLALAVTDADGHPLDALVIVRVTHLGYDDQLYQWHTNDFTQTQTLHCVSGYPSEELTWDFNGFWENFATVRVESGEWWSVEISITKTGYRPQQYYWNLGYSDVHESSCYGMYRLLPMQELTP